MRRAPEGTLPTLSSARPVPLAGGFVLYVLAFAARGARLDRLLPPSGRIPFGRAWGLSGASTFLLQVIPFRGGEAATWALFRRELGGTWARSGAVFALTKALDSGSFLVAGLAGGAALSFRAGVPLLGAAALAGAVAVVAALALLPRAGGALTARLAATRWSRSGGRLERFLAEFEAGLAAARGDPRAYAAAFAFSLAFLAAHVLALFLMTRGLGLATSVAGIAVASLASVLSSAAIPSPAGTFGSMESGFTAGLVADGALPGAAVVTAATLHILATLASGVAALPLLRPPRDSG